MPRKPSHRDPSDVGGIPSTAESATGRSVGQPADVLPKPAARARSTKTPVGAAKPRSKPAARGYSAKAKTQRDEGPLESLGKAVSSPVRGTADEEEGEKPA